MEKETKEMYKCVQARPTIEGTEELLTQLGSLGWKVVCSYCTGYFVLKKEYIPKNWRKENGRN